MRILHVTPLYEPAWKAGGVVRAISLLCRGLVSLGHKVTVYTTNTDGTNYLSVPVNQPVDVGGVEVWYFHTPMPRFFRYSRELAKACRNSISKFDIVHIASFWNYPAIPASKECKKRRIPYVVSTHGTLVPSALSYRRRKKQLYFNFFDKKVVSGSSALHYTTFLERKMMQSFRVKKPSFLIPNGLDIEEFKCIPKRIDFRNSIGVSEDAIVITFLGRLNWVKGLGILLKGFAKVCHKHLNVFLVLAGPDGGEKKSLDEISAKLGIKDKVVFIGPVGNYQKMNLFAASDLLTLVSWTENFGYAAVEAMAAGIPVLVSENVGICDAVKEDGAGLVVPVDEDAIASALIEMLSDSEKLKEMGKAAYESARERYDIKVVSKLMATAYEDILTGRRSPECSWEE